MRAVAVPYEVAPAIAFRPAPGDPGSAVRGTARPIESAAGQRPQDQQDLMVRVVLKENQVMLDLMVHLDRLALLQVIG